MESDEITNDIVRIDSGFTIVDEEAYVVHSDDILDEENNSDGGGKNMPLREQDRFLPIANIAKIMKRAIPENGKIAKDARECVQECISEFISFITSEASDRCQIEKRKTINGEDILFAMNTLGFDNYVEPMKIYLKKYREIVLSPVTINKVNRTIVIYNEDGTTCVTAPSEGEEAQSDSTFVYTYPKAMDSFQIT